jgi:hypothetical protein
LCMPLLGSCCGCFYEHEKENKTCQEKNDHRAIANMVETNKEG